jgi:hypothetical protein
MNKIKAGVAIAVIATSLNSGGVLAQASTCTITGTGANSTNSCTFDTNNVVTVVCTNGVDVSNVVSQSAVSGSVSATGNTIVGTATSGAASNVNVVAAELAQACLAVAPAPAPTPNPTPGRGNEGRPTPAPRPPVVTGLPNTSGSFVVERAGIAATGVVLVGGASVVALRAYRRQALKNLS